MKILIVSSSDIVGGAAKAAYRLHRALLEYGEDSQMVVMRKETDDVTVSGPSSHFGKGAALFYPVVEKLMTDVPFRKKKKSMFSGAWIPSRRIINKINSINPDVVHLHWVNGGMLQIEDLKKINAPIIWNLQDMWPFTGGCHFTDDCVRYKASCGSCKVLSSKSNFDLSRLIHIRKNKSFKKINKLVINGPSQWLGNWAKDSSLFKDREVVNVPNTIDSSLFRPIDKKTARQSFNLPQGKTVVLFGASNVHDLRKGYAELLAALTILDYPNLILVVAGQSKPIDPIISKFPVYYIPPVHDDVSLSLMYNVANVVVVPSLQENLANTIIESLSCGVPVVGFNIGGNSDMVEHRENGYLAQPLDVNDMAYGISWTLGQDSSLLSKNAREKVLKTFSYAAVINRYIDLYRSLL